MQFYLKSRLTSKAAILVLLTLSLVSYTHLDVYKRQQYNGEDLMIAFNAKFLIEMLNATESDEVNLELSTPTKAGLIKPTDQDENEDLLMPVSYTHLDVYKRQPFPPASGESRARYP